MLSVYRDRRCYLTTVERRLECHCLGEYMAPYELRLGRRLVVTEA